MKFQKILLVTGTDIKTRKDGTPYHIIHILMDNGQTCSLAYKGDLVIFNKLKYMEHYVLDFEITFSQYGTRVECINLSSYEE